MDIPLGNPPPPPPPSSSGNGIPAPVSPPSVEPPTQQLDSGVPETLVVPPAGSGGGFPTQDIGQEAGAENQIVPPRGGGGFLKALLKIVLIFIVIGALGVGGWYAYTTFMGQKEATITYWGLWENDTIVSAVIADFEAKNPSIKVEYSKQSPKQYRERLQAAIARDEGPDVFRFHNTWVAMIHSNLAPVPQTVITPAEFSSTFYPVASADLVAGSTIYGLPLMIDGLGLYYNEDIFASIGVTPPTTWEEMLGLVPSLTVKNEEGITTSAIALGTTGNIEHFSDIMAVMFMQNGAKIQTPTGKEAEEALVFYRKFADPADPMYTWNDSFDNSIVAFANGRVAMILAPSWRTFEIKQINPDLHFRIAPIPQLPGNTVSWASYWVEGVSAKSKYQKQAWEFVKYLTSKEGATLLYTEAAKVRLFGEPYARVDLGDTVTEDPFVGAYIKQAPSARSFPLASRTFDNGINDKLTKYVEDAINGFARGSAPSAVLETASAGFQQVLESYGLASPAAPQQQ